MKEVENVLLDVIVSGAGLAGLTAAIHLRKKGWKVLCIEKNALPRHKVCGEFLSNEIRDYLISLGFNPKKHDSAEINKFTLYSQNGKSISHKLDMGGFGISRYKLDKELYDLACKEGVVFVHNEITSLINKKDSKIAVCLNGDHYLCRTFVSATGKRSKLDASFKRPFIEQRTSWMGVKAHYKGEWENDKVALYQFDGGYCGVSKVEDNVINVCYLVNTSAFKKVGDLRRFEDEVMCQNPNFNEVYRRLNRVMERKVISQIYFGKKEKVNDQVAFLGDAAGMIFPLAGNGMAIAVHSAKIYCDLIDEFLKGNKSMEDVERLYEKKWLSLFNARIVNSKRLQLLMENSLLSKIAINMLTYIPFVFKRIIKGTHGKKVNVFN